ncbi:hypothetical protein FN846DRAFT_517291 [Sphaerosporella brunnea]|uniref:Uncharacterized protein n=1 Tax=Sphaerosporella brunnea TaxID=1250544 RepID=A0A5J5F3C9_9PEZI|nr:hypothetical protein FN846DRAFT_517291 [Sphaerosporella brunnea]
MSSASSTVAAQKPAEQEPWTDRLYGYLESITPRTVAAACSSKHYPNPMLVVVGPGAPIYLSLPLEYTQLSALRLSGKIIPDPNMGLEVISNEFLRACNPEWLPWVSRKIQAMVKEKFQLDKTESQLEFGFVVSSDHAASGFGQELGQKHTVKHFAKLLVTLPTFDDFNVTVTKPDMQDEPLCMHGQAAANGVGDMTFTLWYHGLAPTVLTRGTSLCLLYTIYLPAEHSKLYQPWQLSLPDDISSMKGIKDCLEEFISQTRTAAAHDDDEKVAYFIFDGDYSSYDCISGADAARRDKLVEAALEVGLNVYYGKITREEKGTAEGWADPDDYYPSRYDRYWHGEDSEPEKNGNGNYIMGGDPDTSYLVEVYHDVQLKDENQHLYISDPDMEQFIPYEPSWCSDEDAGFEQSYDDDDGGLTNTWTRSTLVMWPRECNADAVTQLFGSQSAYLLDQTASAEGERQSIQASIEIAEKLLLSPDVCHKYTHPPACQDSSMITECRRLFLNFSCRLRRLDLFTSTLRKFGLPTSDQDFALLREAVDTFSSTENEDSKSQIVDMCIASEPNSRKKLEVGIKIFGQDVVAGLVTKHFAGKELGAIFSWEELLKMDKKTVRDVHPEPGLLQPVELLVDRLTALRR